MHVCNMPKFSRTWKNCISVYSMSFKCCVCSKVLSAHINLTNLGDIYAKFEIEYELRSLLKSPLLINIADSRKRCFQ